MQDLEDSVANTGLADIPPPVHDKVCSEPMERSMLSIAVDSWGSIDGGEWSMNMTSFAYALLLITRTVRKRRRPLLRGLRVPRCFLHIFGLHVLSLILQLQILLSTLQGVARPFTV